MSSSFAVVALSVLVCPLSAFHFMQAIRAKSDVTATAILEPFLEMVGTAFSMLSTRTEIPSEIRTELLSLVFASSRWKHVPELGAVRLAFECLFGRQAFSEVTKQEVAPDCGVLELLLKCMSNTPAKFRERVAMAEDIMEELSSTWRTGSLSREDLEAVRYFLSEAQEY
jgi:Regulator of Vps4 activity in the MVB pathway